MRSLTVAAPAKLNLFLHVTGRRADGYHLLETAMVALDLADAVTVARREDGAVHRAGGWAGVPEEQDLAVRAALALKAATGCASGADLTVEKRIPVGGGMGGGSSDAAAILLALDRLWALGLTRARLAEVGLALGADVPVFRERCRRGLARGDASAALGCSHRSAGGGVDRGDLRGARIDTQHAVGENKRLFRGLWSERPRAHRVCAASGDQHGAGGSAQARSPGTDDGVGKRGLRSVRVDRRGGSGDCGATAGNAWLRGPHARPPPARRVRMILGTVPCGTFRAPRGARRFHPLGSRQVG
jgi:hypothetical protein